MFPLTGVSYVGWAASLSNTDMSSRVITGVTSIGFALRSACGRRWRWVRLSLRCGGSRCWYGNVGSERGPERILFGVIERAPDHRAAGALEVLENFIGRHLADEEKEAGRPWLQGLVRLSLHVLIVDAVVVGT